MSSEMGVFALRQVVSSMVVLGPLLIIAGAFSFVFNQNKKAIAVYIIAGLFLTAIGAVSLYRQFGDREQQTSNADDEDKPELPEVNALKDSKDKL